MAEVLDPAPAAEATRAPAPDPAPVAGAPVAQVAEPPPIAEPPVAEPPPVAQAAQSALPAPGHAAPAHARQPGLPHNGGPRPAFTNGHPGPAPAARPASHPVGDNGAATDHHDQSAERGATGPQLRRFIKSRAYVPMHELRRRFVINGADDDVTPVDLGEHRRVFVGLPEREGRLLGELLRAGDIGYELSLDPISPIVVGVYPMRPVARGGGPGQVS